MAGVAMVMVRRLVRPVCETQGGESASRPSLGYEGEALLKKPQSTRDRGPYLCRGAETPGLSPSELAETTCEPLTWGHFFQSWDPRVQSELKRNLGIDWIDELPLKLQNDIDGQFAEAAAGQAPVVMPPLKQSVIRPPTADVFPREVKMLARVNFMAWALQVFDSADAAKAHFRSIQPVKGRPTMWLAEGARTAFERAVAAFEAKHPGYTIVNTAVATALRGRHQMRTGLGMLGHALGFSFDLKAAENPNLKLPDGFGYRTLIEKFGGVEGKSGRAVMAIEERDIERIGTETFSPTSRYAEAYTVVEDVRQQFEEMVATSKRFKGAMAEQLPQLQAARKRYFDGDRERVTDDLHVAFRDWLTRIDADIKNRQEALGLQSNQDDIQNGAEVLRGLAFFRRALLDPKFVFGTPTKEAENEKGGYPGFRGSYRYEDVPLMQLLELGFVRTDPMLAPPSAGEKLEVFNAEVVATLAEFGFCPGATFGDTMHFDYLAGYNTAVPGGRSLENMSHSRFSPEGPDPSSCDEAIK